MMPKEKSIKGWIRLGNRGTEKLTKQNVSGKLVVYLDKSAGQFGG